MDADPNFADRPRPRRKRRTGTGGPYPKTYSSAGEILERRDLKGRWYIALLHLNARLGIDKGLEPRVVEVEATDRLLETARLVTGRLFGEAIPLILLELGELRRLTVWLANRVREDADARHSWYPTGWRDSLRFVRGIVAISEQPAQPAREPGQDDDA